jgi:hypothetical protein
MIPWDGKLEGWLAASNWPFVGNAAARQMDGLTGGNIDFC